MRRSSEFPYDPPEWGFDRRDFMMAEPLRTDRDGWLNLSSIPGMGYALDESALAATLFALNMTCPARGPAEQG